MVFLIHVMIEHGMHTKYQEWLCVSRLAFIKKLGI